MVGKGGLPPPNGRYIQCSESNSLGLVPWYDPRRYEIKFDNDWPNQPFIRRP
jgi:hypothetical protein